MKLSAAILLLAAVVTTATSAASWGDHAFDDKSEQSELTVTGAGIIENDDMLAGTAATPHAFAIDPGTFGPGGIDEDTGVARNNVYEAFSGLPHLMIVDEGIRSSASGIDKNIDAAIASSSQEMPTGVSVGSNKEGQGGGDEGFQWTNFERGAATPPNQFMVRFWNALLYVCHIITADHIRALLFGRRSQRFGRYRYRLANVNSMRSRRRRRLWRLTADMNRMLWDAWFRMVWMVLTFIGSRPEESVEIRALPLIEDPAAAPEVPAQASQEVHWPPVADPSVVLHPASSLAVLTPLEMPEAPWPPLSVLPPAAATLGVAIIPLGNFAAAQRLDVPGSSLQLGPSTAASWLGHIAAQTLELFVAWLVAPLIAQLVELLAALLLLETPPAAAPLLLEWPPGFNELIPGPAAAAPLLLEPPPAAAPLLLEPPPLAAPLLLGPLGAAAPLLLGPPAAALLPMGPPAALLLLQQPAAQLLLEQPAAPRQLEFPAPLLIILPAAPHLEQLVAPLLILPAVPLLLEPPIEPLMVLPAAPLLEQPAAPLLLEPAAAPLMTFPDAALLEPPADAVLGGTNRPERAVAQRVIIPAFPRFILPAAAAPRLEPPGAPLPPALPVAPLLRAPDAAVAAPLEAANWSSLARAFAVMDLHESDSIDMPKRGWGGVIEAGVDGLEEGCCASERAAVKWILKEAVDLYPFTGYAQGSEHAALAIYRGMRFDKEASLEVFVRWASPPAWFQRSTIRGEPVQLQKGLKHSWKVLRNQSPIAHTWLGDETMTALYADIFLSAVSSLCTCQGLPSHVVHCLIQKTLEKGNSGPAVSLWVMHSLLNRAESDCRRNMDATPDICIRSRIVSAGQKITTYEGLSQYAPMALSSFVDGYEAAVFGQVR